MSGIGRVLVDEQYAAGRRDGLAECQGHRQKISALEHALTMLAESVHDYGMTDEHDYDSAERDVMFDAARNARRVLRGEPWGDR